MDEKIVDSLFTFALVQKYWLLEYHRKNVRIITMEILA